MRFGHGFQKIVRSAVGHDAASWTAVRLVACRAGRPFGLHANQVPLGVVPVGGDGDVRTVGPDALSGHLGLLLIKGLKVLVRLAHPSGKGVVVEAGYEGAAVDLVDAAAVVAEEHVLALGPLNALLVGGSRRVAHDSIVSRDRRQARLRPRLALRPPRLRCQGVAG